MAVLASCTNKQAVKNANLNTEITWQYSDYLNGLRFSDEKKLKKNDFFVSKVSGSGTFPLVAYPIIGKDYVIVMDKTGSVIRIDSSSKKIDWKHDATGQKIKFFANYLNGGLSQNSGKIYATYGTNLVNCIDSKTGKSLWSKNLQEIIRAYPVISNGVVFLQTLSNGMYALNSENGNVMWYKAGLTEDVSVINVTSPILYHNSLITQDSTGNLASVSSSTGLEDWVIDNSDRLVFDFNLDAKDALIYQPIRVGEDLYFYSANGHLYKLHLPSRNVVWKAKFGINRPFYISSKAIFMIDDMDNIIAIAANNGSEIWKAKLSQYLDSKEKGKSRYWNSPVVINNNVYALSSTGDLLSFDVNGKFIKAEYQMGMGSYIPPIYVGDKAIIISSK